MTVYIVTVEVPDHVTMVDVKEALGDELNPYFQSKVLDIFTRRTGTVSGQKAQNKEQNVVSLTDV